MGSSWPRTSANVRLHARKAARERQSAGSMLGCVPSESTHVHEYGGEAAGLPPARYPGNRAMIIGERDSLLRRDAGGPPAHTDNTTLPHSMRTYASGGACDISPSCQRRETFMPIDYVITIQGHLDAHWSAWFDGLTITNRTNGQAMLTGPVTDQASLHGLLLKIRDLGLPLISIMPADATADDPLSHSATSVSAPKIPLLPLSRCFSMRSVHRSLAAAAARRPVSTDGVSSRNTVMSAGRRRGPMFRRLSRLAGLHAVVFIGGVCRCKLTSALTVSDPPVLNPHSPTLRTVLGPAASCAPDVC